MGTTRLAVLILVPMLCVQAFAGQGATGQGAEAPLNPKLLALADSSWLNLKAAGMAKARMYSGACFGGGCLWYFGGAHRSYPGNDVELFDPRSNRWIQATEPETPPRGSREWKALVGGGTLLRGLTRRFARFFGRFLLPVMVAT